jgi:hypothetical protein
MPAPHGCPGPHAAPSAPGDVHTSVSVVHVSVAPQLVSWAHESPCFGGFAHVPQALPGTMAQKVLPHCEG